MSVAKINNKMMYWAREYAGYINGYENELPKDIKDKIQSWESGDKYPTWIQLRKVSKKFKVPTAFFFMKNPPEYESIPEFINYRKINNNITYEGNSPSLIDNIHSCENRRSIFIEIRESMDENIPTFEQYEGEVTEYNLSSLIREKLGVSVETQKAWLKEQKHDKNHYNILNHWKNLLTEKMGVLIFETHDVDIDEMRGLCIYHETAPIILLNGKDSANGRIFSLFHELTHLLLGQKAICGDDTDRKVEILCNAVSGEFLVPSDDLNRNYLTKHSLTKSVEKLSDIYGVSVYVILRRLLDTNKITKEEYDSKSKHYDNIAYDLIKTEGSHGNYYRNMIKYNGKPFYSTLLNAYDNNLINGSDFTKITGIKIKQIPKIEEIVYGGKI